MNAERARERVLASGDRKVDWTGRRRRKYVLPNLAKARLGRRFLHAESEHDVVAQLMELDTDGVRAFGGKEHFAPNLRKAEPVGAFVFVGNRNV
jgi:hypothetical protein